MTRKCNQILQLSIVQWGIAKNPYRGPRLQQKMERSPVGHDFGHVTRADTRFVRSVNGHGGSQNTFCWPVFVTAYRHGPHTSCPLPVTSGIIKAYLSASAAERTDLERRYGRANVQRLVRQHQEEEENHKWLESSTTECPKCNLRIEKSMGCNHVCFPLCKMFIPVTHGLHR